ncbi:hypothetical protein ACFQY4_27260 [Catellatospora bangladeshensis]|uniref:hypothetical protein n=1 Tax=Catellatospora bangladeshensis TaxID=310355 RepID=UPI003614D075
MDRLRTPFFFVALVAMGLIVAVETGSSFLLGLTTPAVGTAAQLGADVPPGWRSGPAASRSATCRSSTWCCSARRC